jgi:hypothetical protein
MLQIVLRASILAAAFLYASGGVHATSLAEGDDYATAVLGDAWDMSNRADVFPLLWTHNLSSANVSGGMMTATARDTDPHFWFQFPRFPSSILPANSRQVSIDADRFTRLSVMMWLPDSIVPGASSGRLVWHHGGDTSAEFEAAYSVSSLFAVYPGWHFYDFDLAAMSITSGRAWSGTIGGLRIDPCVGCNLSFKIDWARLYGSQGAGHDYTLSSGDSALVIDNDTDASNGILTVLAGDNGQASLAALPPGTYQVAPIGGGDYALTQRGDPWDFDSSSDLLWSSTNDFTNARVAGNQFSGTTAGADPFVLLDIPARKPIDAATYRHLAIDMTLGSLPAQEPGLAVFWGTQTATPQYQTAFIPVSAGRQTYNIDLGSYANWSGTIKALRIDPLNGINAGNSVAVAIHAVRLTDSAGLTETIRYEADPVTVNARPTVSIVAPSYDTGEDYAEAELGAGWTMAGTGIQQPQLGNLNGWEYIASIPDLGVTGSFFHATSQPAAAGNTEGDPYAFLVYQQNAKPIDGDTYRWLGYDLYVSMDATQQSELTVGAMSRIVWKTGDTDTANNSDDIVLMPGLNTYWLDMKNLRYEPASTRVWSGSITYLRIDPFEFPDSRHFYLGRARLTAVPTGRYVVPVVLQLGDADGDSLSVEIRSGQAVLAQQSGLAPDRVELLASLAELAEGEHHLSAIVSDGTNSSTVDFPVPIKKLSLATPLTSYEQRTLDRVFNWAEAVYPQVLAPATASTFQHACAVPGSYARRYAGSNFCLFGIDGAVGYTQGDATIHYAGRLADLLGVAAAAGF